MNNKQELKTEILKYVSVPQERKMEEMLRTEEDGQISLAIGEENILEKREVKIGADDGKFVEILSGLRENEIVVTSATKGLEDGMKVEISLVD